MGLQANEYSYPWLEEGEVPPLPLDRDRIHIIYEALKLLSYCFLSPVLFTLFSLLSSSFVMRQIYLFPFSL